jgi:transposase
MLRRKSAYPEHCQTIFFDRFKVDKLIEGQGHKILWLPPHHCHFNPTGLVWLQAKRYYKRSFGQNWFKMDAVTKMWEESLEQVCSFCSKTTKQRRTMSHEILSITNLV